MLYLLAKIIFKCLAECPADDKFAINIKHLANRRVLQLLVEMYCFPLVLTKEQNYIHQGGVSIPV